MSLRSPSGFIRPNYDPLEVADAPTAVTPSAGNQSASINCTAPADVGGSAITSYYAVVNPGGFTGTSVTPPIPVTGLTNGTEYTAKVWANNSYGPSPYSAESAGFTPVNDYIEDVFSTYLYTGNSSTQTITNGIDLSGEGGLVWVKSRTNAASHELVDTVRGGNKRLQSNTTGAESAASDVLSFNSDGFNLQYLTAQGNASGQNYASWTFRKAPKFFDVVTYTGNGTAGRTVAHNLGSVPGMIIVKDLGQTTNWRVYHRGLGALYALSLNLTDAAALITAIWNDTEPTDTVFTVGDNGNVNGAGRNYVAYLFAHNAGGFGDDGLQNVISCGSYTGAYPSTVDLNLGFEPQWLLIKNASQNSNWGIFDVMRGLPVNDGTQNLAADSSAAENGVLGGATLGALKADGFTINSGLTAANVSGSTHIYIAIRRPMKTPTAGTEVFAPVTYTGNGSTQIATTGFPVDAMIEFERTNSSGVPAAGGKYITDRLRGSSAYLETSGTSVEGTGFVFGLDNNTGVNLSSYFNSSSRTYIIEALRRAPGFFDVVAYTGTGSATTVSHNLGVAPELMIVKKRSASGTEWATYTAPTGNTQFLNLNSTAAASSSSPSSGYWNNTTPTSSVFSLGNWNDVNSSGATFIAYLFATLAGVSKVGSYTGTAADLNVDCGFSAGARFVLIKRTDSTGDWYVWDSARGIVAGNDPYLLLNDTAAEVTNTDYVDAYSAGFTVTSSAPAALNASGGTYIFLAIA